VWSSAEIQDYIIQVEGLVFVIDASFKMCGKEIGECLNVLLRIGSERSG